jgi:hypothetical protein
MCSYEQIFIHDANILTQRAKRPHKHPTEEQKLDMFIHFSAFVTITKERVDDKKIAILTVKTTLEHVQVPPLASRSIFNMDLGPNVVRMMSDTACT